jgi:tetratricopeptide (TPR) repeat protein
MPFIKKSNVKQVNAATETRKIFIGRADELHFFVEHILSPEEPTYNILSISGNGGVGKSTLLARYSEEIRSPRFREYCMSAFVDEQQPTPDGVMEKFAEQLSKAGAPLVKFEKELTRYKEVAHKLQIEQENAQDTAIRATVDLVGTVAEGVPAVGGLLHKGANIVTDLGLKEYHSRQSVKDAMLLDDPISDLTRIFVEELNRLTETQIISNAGRSRRSQRIILFLDTFERTAFVLAPWLLDHFLQANISTDVVLVVAGRDSLEHSLPDDPKRWLPYRDNDVISFMSLNSFTEEETRAYLAARGVTDPDSMNTIWQLSRGLPLYLGLLTFHSQGTIDPTEGVVANFLRWIPEQDHVKRRLAIDAALFSRPFNQDDLTAFTYIEEQDLENMYQWLIRLPFLRMSLQGGRYRYHELAQEMFRRYLYQRSQKDCAATTRALVNYYTSVLDDMKKESGKEDHSSIWLEVQLALAFQLFSLPEAKSHIEGCELILYAWKNTKTEQKSEVIEFLKELSQNQENRLTEDSQNSVKLLLQFSKADSENQAQEQIDALSDLLTIVRTSEAFGNELLIWLHRKRGVAYTDLKDYQRALQDHDAAIELNPVFAPAYVSRSLVYYYFLKEYERAIQELDRAIALDPSSADAYNTRGAAYLELEKYESAKQDFERAIALDPDFTWAFHNRGIVYYTLKEYKNAIQDHSRAIELDPHYPSAYANRGKAYHGLHDFPHAVQDYSRAIELDPKDPNHYLNRGYTYSNLSDYVKAIEDFTHSIEIEADNAQVYYYRGIAYFNLKNYQRAIQDYDRAIELDPDQSQYFNNRGLAFYDLKEYQRAIQDYDRAIELDPHTAMLYARRALVYSTLKEYQRTIPDLDRAIELNPENIIVFYNFRGDMYWELKQYQQAIDDYDRTIAINPYDANAQFGRGCSYLGLQEYERAILEINRAIELDPNDARFYQNRGVAYLYLKEYERAIQDYDRSIELNPRFELTYHNRAKAYYQLKDFKHAIQDLNEIIKLNPNDGGPKLILGMVHLWLKDIVKARECFNQSRELSPTVIYSGWILAWLDMCLERNDTASIERLESIADSAPQQTIACICRGVLCLLRKSYTDALSELEGAVSSGYQFEEAPFWKAMTFALLDRDEEALASLEQAMTGYLAIPPILLAPLHWLELDRPNFYKQYVVPLLERYEIL